MNHIFLEIAFVITVMYCNTKHSCWGFADPNDCSTGVLRHVSLRRVIPLLLPTAVLNYLSGSAESCWKALKQRQGTQIDVEEKENPVNWKEGYFQMERWTDEQLLTICNSSGFFFLALKPHSKLFLHLQKLDIRWILLLYVMGKLNYVPSLCSCKGTKAASFPTSV